MDVQTDSPHGAVNVDSKDESESNRTDEMDEDTEVMEIDLTQAKQMRNEEDGAAGANKKPADDEEGGDEPDAMNTLQQDLSQVRDFADKKKLYNGYIESGSEEEDMEEGDRLVIDDVAEGALSKGLPKSGRVPDRIYSCPKCDMVTVSPKAYLYHLDTVHRARDGSKIHQGFLLPEKRENVNSPCLNTKNKDSSDYMNLSIPLTEQSPSVVADDEDEDGEGDRHDSSQLSLNLSSHSATMSLTIPPDSIDIDKMFEDDKKKKKKTRQEVDPGKYFEAVDSSGTKYACSQCGNIYKWRKSLNKHWKEKHLHDPLVEMASPPGMLELLKSGKYTQLGSRRIYDNNFLATIKTQKDDNNSLNTSTPSSLRNTPSPPSFLNSSQILNSSAAAARLVASMATTIPPKMIGPFVANGTQPVFPGMGLTVPHHLPLQNGFESASEESALDLTRDSKPDNGFCGFPTPASHQDINNSFDQEQPLDFSKKKDDVVPIKHEKLWEEISTGMKHSQGVNQYISKVHRCSKCDYTSTSESDFAAHTGSHYNKRVVKCFECKIQLNSMEELNSHFSKDHNKKLTEYKEAIKKIPHGLQQTYHLLKMDLQSIGELNNQDLGSSDSKSLKCKKCDFEAKWPAELQKHAVSHSEERPYICMVCGSTYKWKWDLVKHFQKSHPILPNPYRRNDKRDTPDGSSEEDLEDEPEAKKPKMSGGESALGNLYSTDDGISVEGIIAATQAGQRFVSSQPNLLDNDPTMEHFAFMRNLPLISAGAAGLSLSPDLAARQSKAQKVLQDTVKNHPNGNVKNPVNPEPSTSPGPSGSKGEQLPYKCTMCNYHARWPSEVTQHMKNHSDSKPYLCPRCDYRSKWKWDVVKHLKRCGGGTINDVIDTTKMKKKDNSNCGPPNAIVSQHGKVKKMTPQPFAFLTSMDVNNQQGAVVFPRSSDDSGSATSLSISGDMDQNQNDDVMVSEHNPSDNNQSSDSDLIDLTTSNNNNNNNNNDDNRADNNVNNNYAAYSSGQPVTTSSSSSMCASSLTPPTTDSIGNTSRNPSPVPTPVITPSSASSRQNSSAEIWDCPHCTFSTQSQAELKRHSGLHKDDKPFKCDECHYSTRWACDLKKHRKSYDHYPKRNNPFLGNTASKDMARPMMEQQQQKGEEKAKVVESKARFKCFQCSTYFTSLQELMDHRKTSHADKDNSSQLETVKSHEIDAARIKHPRKQIRQISCPKCPFLCKSRQTMDQHMEEHEQMEKNALHCFYCSSQFKDKESLLDHIVSHPAFNPKEWETFFMISEEEEQQQREESNEEMAEEPKEKPSPSRTPINSDKRDNSTKNSDDAATQARIQQILSEIPKQKPTTASCQLSPVMTFHKYRCEWCPAEFINLTAVYKHASQAHPVQLREQDNNMSQAYANLHNKNHEAQHKASSRAEPAEALLLLKQQIAEKRNQQLTEKLCHMVTNNHKLQEVLNKRLEVEENKMGGKKYQCDKCNFCSPSLQTFHRHYELHGSKMPSQCWFCDYSVDRMDLLYQHMKISHTRKWKALSQDPKYASQIQRMNLAFSHSSSAGNNNDSPPGTSPATVTSNEGMAMDLSSKRSATDMSHDIVYVTRQQYTWSGIPVNVVPGDNTLNFVCPICTFTDASIGNTCTHVMQSHSALSKFNCKRCNFSDDNIHIMSDHCKTSHPVSERIVEVLDFKQLNFTDFQMVQLNAMKEKNPQLLNAAHNAKKSAANALDDNEAMTKYLSCPFCPFRSPTKEDMKQHVLHHNSDSRFRCEQCDFSVDSPTIMTEHVRVHAANYMSDDKLNIKSEMNIKQEKHCHSESELKANNSMAMKEMQKDKESNNGDSTKSASPKSKNAGRIRYRCSVCPYHTTCKSNIFKHKRQHVIPKRYKCPQCSYSAARAVLLRNHIESHGVPVEDDGYYHDIFYDPNSSTNEKIEDGEDVEIEGDDESSASDDLESEMDTKAIADLEAKDIMEAEAAFKASMLMEDTAGGDNALDKQFRKQKCAHCPFSSNSAYEFRKHLHFHGTQERYKCDHCNYSIDRLNLLTQHRKLHADESNFNVNPPASNLLNTSFILQQNELNATSEKGGRVSQEPNMDGTDGTSVGQFHCAHCPYVISCKKSFEIHASSHGQRKRYICDYCDWSADRLALLNHHRKVHENEPSYNADAGVKSFLNQEFDDGTSGEFEAKFMEIPNVDKPAKTGDGESAKSPPFKLTVVKKSYHCKQCPYSTKSKSSYQFHETMHGYESEFKCSECNFAAINKGILQQHILLHSVLNHSNSLLQTCSRSLSHGEGSEAEEAMDTGVDQLKGGNLTDESSSPAKIHSGSKQGSSMPELPCERCPFTAPSVSALKEHMKCHNVQEKLACPYCDFGATTREIMFPHIQIHFPGTKLEPSAMERMLEEHAGKTNNNNNMDNTNKNAEGSLSLSSVANTQESLSAVKESQIIKTKIYVCQYCEREFEAKSLMIQHEKQHLVGGSHME